jgi:hypothetical protein
MSQLWLTVIFLISLSYDYVPTAISLSTKSSVTAVAEFRKESAHLTKSAYRNIVNMMEIKTSSTGCTREVAVLKDETEQTVEMEIKESSLETLAYMMAL